MTHSLPRSSSNSIHGSMWTLEAIVIYVDMPKIPNGSVMTNYMFKHDTTDSWLLCAWVDARPEDIGCDMYTFPCLHVNLTRIIHLKSILFLWLGPWWLH